MAVLHSDAMVFSQLRSKKAQVAIHFIDFSTDEKAIFSTLVCLLRAEQGRE